jgi:hypothetical protein
MSAPLELPMPPDYDLDDTYQIRVTAIDAATGAVVAGVNVGNVTLMVDNLSGGDLASGTFGPFMLVPGPGA